MDVNEQATILLDQYADYLAQSDALEIEKRRLLAENKVPADVQAIVERGDNEADALTIAPADAQTIRELRAALDAVQIPEEIRAAYAEFLDRRASIQTQLMEAEGEASKRLHERRSAIRAEARERVRAVFEEVENRRREIDAEFSEKASAVAVNVEDIRRKIKALVTQAKKSARGKLFQAVYQKGRITWETDVLDGILHILIRLEAQTHDAPEINLAIVDAIGKLTGARHEGEPSVTIRGVK